jgi:hypothetical protein
MRSSTGPGQDSQVDLDREDGRYGEWRDYLGTNKNEYYTTEYLL